ncbi:MAG: hypothetical protein IKF29_17105 [Oceanobacillus sp.]|nr:hypothetical protein [Oceanobacillus sp.]
MNVRNCIDIGVNAQYIVKRLLANQNLLKLLYYTDKDPLSHDDLTPEQIQDEIFNKLVKIVPRVGPKETAHSIIAVRIARARGLASNNEFKSVNISVEVFVPMTQWIIKDTNLRPFAIMGEVQKSLNGKKIEGLGKLTGGDFSLNFLTEEISAYEQTFVLTSYD